MIYLDYSATTPVNDEVLDSFVKVSKNFIGNSNSLHKLGVDSKKIIDSATNQISLILNVKPEEIIYTSGSSEANNTAVMSVLKYPNRGKHIITSKLEHSSIAEPLKFLESLGYIIDYVKLDKNGMVDLKDLEDLITSDTALVTIASVNSEVGILQDISAIGKIVEKYPKCFFHSDITQSIGKVSVDLSNVDMASFSAHKIYGIKGIGCLIKKSGIEIDPLIRGGKSTSIYRSGTPATGLIVSLSRALRLAYSSLEKNYIYVNSLNNYLKSELLKLDRVHINSTINSIPHILNISIRGVKPETLLHTLEEKEIYISTQTACSSNKSISGAVYAVTNSEEFAKSSIRVSLSYLTTIDELNVFIDNLKLILENI